MDAKKELLRSLGFKECLALVIGTVIGTGVFLKAGIMSQQVGSAFWVLAAFALSGILSFCGALCYAELGSLFPQAGGEYVFVREAYGDLPAFLYGWMRFWIGTPGSIAAYAVGSATFLTAIFPGVSIPLAAVTQVCIFSVINCLSVAFGGGFQTMLTALKIFMIISLTLAIFLFGHGTFANVTSQGMGSWPGFSAMGTAMIGALWAYDGWNNMPMVAGEVREPLKNIPRALGIGMAVIFLIYLCSNLSYFFALSFSEVAGSYSSQHPNALPVATLAAAKTFGSGAVIILSVAFIFSAVGAMNGSILTGARIPFAMARDGLFFKKLGTLSDHKRVPVTAVLVQAVVASMLALSGTFDQLTDYVIFASWIFYALVCGSIFILRKEAKQNVYRVPLYFPVIFIFSAIFLLANTVCSSPRSSATGLAFIALGIPFYFWFKKHKSI